MSSNEKVDKLIDHLFRHEAGKITAILTNIFGLHQMELAEDIVQETLLEALNHWGMHQIPDNPSAWIMQVAKRKTINFLRRETYARKYESSLLNNENSSYQIDEVFMDQSIEDSQLKMIFCCCHPLLPRESQIALTLKTLGGFSVPEIAKALLTTNANINKRLYRAKQKFRENDIQFNLPENSELHKRLDSVYLNLYLLFNEGYNSSNHNTLIREDLCLEAIRLSQLLQDLVPGLLGNNSHLPKLHALIALMYFHSARFDARLDKGGGIIIFKDQDRKLWDQDMIATGLYYLQNSAVGNSLSEYHIEAGIAAQHCMSKNYEETDWNSLYKQYELLNKIKNNPVIELNLAIILSKTKGINASIQRLKQIEKEGKLNNYYLLYATIGTLLLERADRKEALSYFEKASSLTNSVVELKFLEEKRKECF